jgi:hypothetical protein
VGAGFLQTQRLLPGVVQALEFVFAADQLRGRVFEDAGEVGSAGRWSRRWRLHRGGRLCTCIEAQGPAGLARFSFQLADGARHRAALAQDGIVERLGHQRTFPVHALAFARNLKSPVTAVIDFGTDAQNMGRRIQTVHHPARPAFGRRASFDVPVQDRGDPIGPEALGQTEHPLAVGVGIVAVADEEGDFA